MPKPDSMDAPGEQSRENAIDARIVEEIHGGPFSGLSGLDEIASNANRKLDEEQAKQRIPDPVFPQDLGARLMAGVDSSATRRDQHPDGATLAEHGFDANLGCNEDGTPLVGNVPPVSGGEQPAVPEDSPCAREDGETIRRRFISEGRWRDISPVRDRMMVESKKAIPDKEARRAWVYSELDRMYPPPEAALPSLTETNTILESGHLSPYVPTKGLADVQHDGGAIQGLGEIPEGWPAMPSNASLGAELGWVQANRLSVVEERPGKATVVRLGRAASPAPSLAALGWLETSIRSYAKYVDVAAKAASGGDDDEGTVMRRERKSVDEVKALLDEMCEAAGACQHCGRSG